MKPLYASMASKLRLVITTGDPDGIGWEVTVKALNRIGPLKGVQFILLKSRLTSRLGPKLVNKFKVKTVSSLSQALGADDTPLIEVCSAQPAALWVEEAARACLKGSFDALVTAPLSKTSVIEAGLKDIGHTEILARISGSSDLFMGFLGSKFNVVLATGHLPLKEAIAGFSALKLRQAFAAAAELRSLLSVPRRRLPMALVGLNPHAGESGLLGSAEGWMSAVMEESIKDAGPIQGPLVPDAAFLPSNWKSYSVYVCPYHDQGLIPFKLVHGFKAGVHLTLGLPFVRTSVDHGTAKELFGKNKAESGSMKEAITTAIRLAKERRR